MTPPGQNDFWIYIVIVLYKGSGGPRENFNILSSA